MPSTRMPRRAGGLLHGRCDGITVPQSRTSVRVPSRKGCIAVARACTFAALASRLCDERVSNARSNPSLSFDAAMTSLADHLPLCPRACLGRGAPEDLFAYVI